MVSSFGQGDHLTHPGEAWQVGAIGIAEQQYVCLARLVAGGNERFGAAIV